MAHLNEFPIEHTRCNAHFCVLFIDLLWQNDRASSYSS